MTPRRALLQLLPLLLAVAAASWACSTTPPEPELAGATPVLRVEELTSPLLAYTESPVEQAAYERAKRVLALRCAARFGVQGTLPAPGTRAPTYFAITLARRYGLVDLDRARTEGYLPDPVFTDVGPGWDPAAEEYAVMNGATEDGRVASPTDRSGRPVPDGGCLREASSALGWTAQRRADREYLVALMDRSYNRTLTDSRVLAATRSWSTCMREAGSGSFAQRDQARQAVGPGDNQQQVAMAVADVTCAQAANLVGTWSAVDQAHQRALMAVDSARLDGIRTRFHASRALVRAVLEG